MIHAIIGIAYVLLNYDLHIIIITGMLFASYYSQRRTRPLNIWIITILWLIALNVLKIREIRDMFNINLNRILQTETFLFLSWMILRLTSATLDVLKSTNDDKMKNSFENILGYIFYFPTILHGPPLIYERYLHMIPLNQYQQVEDFLMRLKILWKILIRLILIYFLVETSMHFIYANVAAMEPEVWKQYIFFVFQNINKKISSLQEVTVLNRWALYGFGIAIGQFFCLKYMVFYGLGSAIAKFERIDAPNPPKCVARIHLYSHMWRYFDQGLHDFLFKYIYKGLSDRNASLAKKLLASITAFTFIYLWHGYFRFVLIWTILNFICLQAENFGKKFSKTQFCKKLMRPIGENNSLRLKAIVGSQLLIISILSNMIFLGGERIGFELMKQTYLRNNFFEYFLLSFCTYCFYISGEFCFRWEARKANEQIANKYATN